MIAVLNSLLQRIILWLKYNISVQFIQYGYKDTLIRTELFNIEMQIHIPEIDRYFLFFLIILLKVSTLSRINFYNLINQFDFKH